VQIAYFLHLRSDLEVLAEKISEVAGRRSKGESPREEDCSSPASSTKQKKSEP